MTTLTPANNKNCDTNNVVDLFPTKTPTTSKHRIIRLSPEYDGLCMLYSNAGCEPGMFYSMTILCWGLRDNGEVVGMVPWLNKLMPCDQLNDEEHCQYCGYYDDATDCMFSEAPPHKVLELETAADYFAAEQTNETDIAQEIPETMGTHAMLSDGSDNFILTEVLSWRLLHNGTIQGMLIDEQNISVTPVLPGDPCLYPADTNPTFCYYFQHHIANQIKAEDPEILAAIGVLFE
ncbi:hypothetical protein [uncultured Oceanicoccus sp.]|uniref:hypothetical protein n=1 Tax=uncultured Oceanicoccus sp. TaxID=1706381 RepID=UPI0030DB028A